MRTCRRLAVLALAMTLAAGAGCGGPSGPEDAVQVIKFADLQNQVRGYGLAIIADIGVSPPPKETRVGSNPCGEDGQRNRPYQVVGNWQIPLSAQQHLPTFRRLRDEWQARGFEMIDYREFPGGVGATVSAADAARHFSMTLTSTDPPTAVALIVASECARTPDGKFPG